ncbi:MAG: hypothetical protein ABGX04_00535 [Myxococcales bacterium]
MLPCSMLVPCPQSSQKKICNSNLPPTVTELFIAYGYRKTTIDEATEHSWPAERLRKCAGILMNLIFGAVRGGGMLQSDMRSTNSPASWPT